MKLICFLLIVFTFNRSIDACYTAFIETNFSGRSFTGCPNKCETLSKNWKLPFKSINTNGSCVRLFELKNCTGRSIDVKSGKKANNLRSIGWMKTNSIKNC